jgi:hypothetical protein
MEGKLCSAQGDFKDLKGFYFYIIIPSPNFVLVMSLYKAAGLDWTGRDRTNDN